MALVWNLFAVPGTLAMLLGFAMAGAVYFLGAHRTQNRRLGILLFCEAIVMGCGAGALYFVGDREDAFATQSLFVTAMIAGPFLNLWFLSTLQTPFVRWLKPLWVQLGLLGIGAVCEIYWLTHPFEFIPGMVNVWYAPWEALLGEKFLLFWSLAGLVSFYSMVCAISAFRRAPKGTPTRERAKLYAFAFGIRDVVFGSLTLILPFFVPPPPSNTWWDGFYIWGYSFASLALITLLVYGVLKTQLFDIDLRLKWTLNRGTLAAIFLAVFFAVGELAQNWLSSSYGWVLGGIATGMLLFALRPIEKAATRLADRAMPSVNASSEYLTFRKLQVYRAALEGAAEDGEITGRERSMLARLRDELGIRPEDAEMLERDVFRPTNAPVAT